MNLKNKAHQHWHKAHLVATIQAGKKLRVVMLYDEGGVEMIPVCLHSAGCLHCKRLLSFYSYVNLGTLHPLTLIGQVDVESGELVDLSPLEMDEVPLDKRSAS